MNKKLPDILSNKWLSKTLLIGIILGVYLLVLRPVRNTLFTLQFNSFMNEEVLDRQELEIVTLEERAVIFQYEEKGNGDTVTWMYTIPFGFYFIIALVAIVLMDSSQNLLYALGGVHGISLILSVALFWAASRWNPHYLAGADLLTRYLIPFCSLTLIPLAYIQKQQTENERKA